MTPSPEFDTQLLAASLETLSAPAIDALPFGVIRLDRDGAVRLYSAGERALSGYRKPVDGKIFFAEIAPCMDNPYFKGRIDKARAEGRLDIRFSFVGDFSDAERRIDVRVQSAADGGTWICMRRPGGER